jgi:hypothetical protein
MGQYNIIINKQNPLSGLVQIRGFAFSATYSIGLIRMDEKEGGMGLSAKPPHNKQSCFGKTLRKEGC